MYALLQTVVSNAVMVVALAAVVWLLGRVLKSPATLHFLWVLVLVKFVTPAVIVVPLPWAIAPLEPVPAIFAATEPHRSVAAADPATTTDMRTRERSSQVAPSPVRQMVPAVVAPKHSTWPLLLAAIWCGGALALAVVRGFHALRFAKLLRTAAGAGPEISVLGQRAASRMGLRWLPPIHVVPLRISPLVWPLGRRASVVLPGDLFKRLTVDAGEAILLHEMAHLRRRDHLVRLLEWGITTAFWWHPVAWYAGRQLRILEEQCCDALVLDRLCCAPRIYALALIETLDYLSTNRMAAPLGAAAVRPAANLTRRIEMLKSPSRQALLTRGQIVLVVALAMVPLVFAVSAGASPTEKQAVRQVEHVGTQQPTVPQEAPTEGLLEKPVVGNNWIAMPITTELQRNFSEGYADAKVFVVINGAPLFNQNDTEFDVGAIDLRGLGDLLESLLVGGMRGTVVIRVEMLRLSNPEKLEPSASQLFHTYLYQFGHRWFRNAIVEMTFHADPEDNFDFEAFAKTALIPVDGIEEAGIGNDYAKVYPIRTPLSSYLSGMDADNTNCVVHFILPENDIPANIVPLVGRYVDRLGLNEKKSVEYLVGSRVQKRLPLGVLGLGEVYSTKELTNRLGFKHYRQQIWLR